MVCFNINGVLGPGHKGMLVSIKNNILYFNFLLAGFPLTSKISGILAPIFLVLYPLYIGLNKKIHTFLGYITIFWVKDPQ